MKTFIMNKTALLVIASLFFAFVATSCEDASITEIIEEVEETTKIETEVLNQTFDVRSSAGVEVPLDPTGAPVDLVGTFINTGTTDAILSIKNDSTLRVIVPQGQMQMMELANLTSLKIMPLGGTGASIEASLQYAPAQNRPGGNFDIKGWGGKVCLGGKGTYHPEPGNDCLFEEVKVWSSAAPRTVSLDIKATGKTDFVVEIEDSNNTFASYKVFAAPATPQHQSIVGEWEDVIAVRIRGAKNPVNGCAPLKLEGTLCYE